MNILLHVRTAFAVVTRAGKNLGFKEKHLGFRGFKKRFEGFKSFF